MNKKLLNLDNKD